MIYASCRRKGPGGSIVFNDTLQYEQMEGAFISEVEGKRVLVVVHGTANSRDELNRLLREIASRNSGSYDYFIMFAWPGGVTGIAYLVTKFTAVKRAAKFLAELINDIAVWSPASIDIDAHSLGVPIALEAMLLADHHVVQGLWLKAGACGRSLAKYREITYSTSVHIFYSPKDWIVRGLYRLWFGFGGALGAYGERTKGGNIGVQYDVSSEIGGSHVDYRRCNIVVQAMRNEAEARKRR